MEPFNYLISPTYIELATQVISAGFIYHDIQDKLAQNPERDDYNKLVRLLCRIEKDVMDAQQKYEDWKKACLANTTDS